MGAGESAGVAAAAAEMSPEELQDLMSQLTEEEREKLKKVIEEIRTPRPPEVKPRTAAKGELTELFSKTAADGSLMEAAKAFYAPAAVEEKPAAAEETPAAAAVAPPAAPVDEKPAAAEEPPAESKAAPPATVGLSPAEDFWGEETVATHGAIEFLEGVDKSFDNPLDGLWNDRGCHHIIQGDSLTWSSGRDTKIKLDSKTSLSILFHGRTVTGKLDDTFKCILWSDADVWERVCLDGVWVDGDNFHQINGSVLKWNGQISTTLTDIAWNSAKRAGAHGQSASSYTVEGLLDASSDRLCWGNEIWLRAGLDGVWCESKHPCAHTLKGSSLKRHSGQVDHVDVLTKNVMMLNIDGVAHEACMNQMGNELRWSDGDIWTRVLRNGDEPNNLSNVFNSRRGCEQHHKFSL